VLYLAPLFGSHPTARSFSPLLLVLAILGGGAAASVADTRAARTMLVGLALALVPVHLAILTLAWQLNGDRPTRVVAGLQDDEGYARETQPYLGAFHAIAQHSAATDRVLLVGESRAFYLERPAVWGSVVDPPPFAAFAGNPPDAAGAAERLHAAGIRFVYFRPSQVRVGARPPGAPEELISYVTPELDAAFRALLSSYARPVLRDGDSWVFALNDVAGDASVPEPRR
jgi:hypothetical protein